MEKIFGLEKELLYDLIDKVKESDLGSFKLKCGDFSLEIDGKRPAPPAPPALPMGVGAVASAAPAQAVAVASVETAAAPAHEGNAVVSPIVGTFYAASSPDKAPFAKVGQTVKKGDVLFIIESMKLMNEIRSEFDGVVSEILVENGQGVEFNQPIMYIK